MCVFVANCNQSIHVLNFDRPPPLIHLLVCNLSFVVQLTLYREARPTSKAEVFQLRRSWPGPRQSVFTSGTVSFRRVSIEVEGRSSRQPAGVRGPFFVLQEVRRHRGVVPFHSHLDM